MTHEFLIRVSGAVLEGLEKISQEENTPIEEILKQSVQLELALTRNIKNGEIVIFEPDRAGKLRVKVQRRTSKM